MKKRNIKMLMLSSLFIIPFTAFNAEAYYTNNNGVDFTEEEYRYVTDLYFDGYQADMTQDDLDFISPTIGSTINKYRVVGDELELINPNICETRGIYPMYASDKDIVLTTSCSGGTCSAIIETDWNIQPGIRSYDLVGFYTSGSHALNTTKIYKDGSLTTTYSNTSAQCFLRGCGQSAKLPTGSFSSLEVIQTFSCAINKTLHVSYQHAISTITKTKSEDFTISGSGMGGVFSHNYSTYYENIGGISITTS